MTGYEFYTDMVVDSIIENHRDLIEDCINGKVDREKLYDDFWVDDSITGNASGSYYCNAYKAAEKIAHAFDLLQDMEDEGFIANEKHYDPEYLDVSARCYVLSQAIDLAIDVVSGEKK